MPFRGADSLPASSDIDFRKYNLFLNNCQDYVGTILFLARDISEQQGIPLIIN